MARTSSLIPRYGKWKKAHVAYQIWNGTVTTNFHFPDNQLEAGFPALRSLSEAERSPYREQLGMVFRRVDTPNEYQLMSIPDAIDVWRHVEELSKGWGDTFARRVWWFLRLL